jgi:hypothetical protein
VAKELKKAEGIATEHPDWFPKWCLLTDPDDGTTPECENHLSPLKFLYPSVHTTYGLPSYSILSHFVTSALA